MANARLKSDLVRANSNADYLADKYGGTSEQWGTASKASLIGGELMDSYATWANSSLSAASIEGQQNEISARASVSTANILSKGEQVQGLQATAFIKSGVKLEGSALNVLNETASNALDAAKIRQQEADTKNTMLEVEKRMAESKAANAPLDFLLGVGTASLTGGM